MHYQTHCKEQTTMIGLGKISRLTSSYKHIHKLLVVKCPHNGNISWCAISSLHYYYYIGGGSGSGLLLLITISCIVYWCCKNNQDIVATTPVPVFYFAAENHNVSMPQLGATGADHSPAPDQVTVRFQELMGNRRMDDYQMQNVSASALLDQLEDLGADVKEHHRRLRPRQYSAVFQIED